MILIKIDILIIKYNKYIPLLGSTMSSPKLRDFLNTRLTLRHSLILLLSRPVKPNEKDAFPAWKDVARYLGENHYPRGFTSDDIEEIELYHSLPVKQSEAFIVAYQHRSDSTVERFADACEKVGATEIANKLRSAQ